MSGVGPAVVIGSTALIGVRIDAGEPIAGCGLSITFGIGAVLPTLSLLFASITDSVGASVCVSGVRCTVSSFGGVLAAEVFRSSSGAAALTSGVAAVHDGVGAGRSVSSGSALLSVGAASRWAALWLFNAFTVG